jgi:hypothetical protein
LRGWGEREGAEWVVREGVGAGGRNDPSLVCTYEKKKRAPVRVRVCACAIGSIGPGQVIF